MCEVSFHLEFPYVGGGLMSEVPLHLEGPMVPWTVPGYQLKSKVVAHGLGKNLEKELTFFWSGKIQGICVARKRHQF